MSFNRWGSIVDGVDPVNTTDTRISEIRSDGVSIYDAIPDSTIYYGVDEGSGNVLSDSQNYSDATSNGTLTWVSDANSEGGFHAELDSTNYVTVDSPPTVGLNKDWSVGITLIRDTQLSNQATFWNWSDGTEQIGLGYRDGNFGFDINNNGGPAHAQPSAPYRIQLVASYDSSTDTQELYLDGATSTTTQNVANSATSGLIFGGDTGTGVYALQSGFDRIAVWDGEAVSPDQYDV